LDCAENPLVVGKCQKNEPSKHKALLIQIDPGWGVIVNPGGLWNMAGYRQGEHLGKIDLSNARNNGAKARTIAVADGPEDPDFTISAAVSDGVHMTEGLFFDLGDYTNGSVTLIDYSAGGVVAGLSGATVTLGWSLADSGGCIVADNRRHGAILRVR
jgi:hypothetical protein